MKKLFIIAAVAIVATACGPKKSAEEKLSEYEEWIEDFMEDFRERMEELEDDKEAAEAFSDSAYNAFVAYNRAALAGNLDNQVGVEALKTVYSDMEPDELEATLDKLTAPLEGRDSAFVASLRQNVVALKATAEGQPFTDFDVDGVKFSDYIGQGKYVLVDFWASWCGPCRMENPNVVRLYNQYHGKGFEIFSVSLDKSHDSWVKAINDDHLSWPNHVSDLKYWSSAAGRLYGISSIPSTVLVGPDGKILARNLRGRDLENKLKKIFEQ